ncbi:MAG: ABC transporter substrate-binding protein, partial [Gammaproteobacteria bacterium]|nr:ABC transporter substrate-binding protein [Gammaproteobacteria bacterium]
MKRQLLIAVVLILMGSQNALAQRKCELDRPVTFAALGWESNSFHTAVAGYIVREGYGCEVRDVPGSTLPLLVAMSTGDVDITMEVWKDNIREAWETAENTGRVRDLGINFADAVQGWFIPRYVQQGDPGRGIRAVAPDLKHVNDLPKYKEIFKDPQRPDKGRFYNCILGWGCEVANTNKLRAYGLIEHYTNYRP